MVNHLISSANNSNLYFGIIRIVQQFVQLEVMLGQLVLGMRQVWTMKALMLILQEPMQVSTRGKVNLCFSGSKSLFVSLSKVGHTKLSAIVSWRNSCDSFE
jgi:hypothetical protein